MITKLQETLSILNFYNGRIEGKLKFIKKNKDFNFNQCFEKEFKRNINPNENFEQNRIRITNIIKENCNDRLNQIHSYFSMNLIEMKSFYDEYKNFNVKCTDKISEKNRIEKIRSENASLMKKINWIKIERFRNEVLAHNMRENNKEKSLAIKTLIEFNSFFSKLDEFIIFCDIQNQIFRNIKLEFSNEINEANEAIKKQYLSIKKEK